MQQHYDMIVIGGGPGGYTAALYAARAGLKTLVLEKLSAGGQMALTSQVDNYPGFAEGIDGFELGQQMQAGAERFGAKTELAEVLSLALDGSIKAVTTSEGTFYGKTVVLSTGANPKLLGVPGEKELTGKGVNFITLMYGEGVTKAEAEAARAAIAAKAGNDVDVTVIDGGQPVYYYFISIE